MPAEVDGTAVAALGALLTVLTFSSGFVSVRLHGAYREALAERRQLEAKLVELASSSGPFPATAVELHHEDIRRSLKDQLAIPVVVFLVLFTVLGVALAVFSGERAGLRWLDSRAPCALPACTSCSKSSGSRGASCATSAAFGRSRSRCWTPRT
jgi:hypothetical protein